MGETDLCVRVSDPAEQLRLANLLRAHRDLRVARVPAPPEAGALGSAEVIQVLGPAAALLAVAIRTLPQFIRSRRSSISVTVTREDKTVTLSGENLEDVEPILKRLLDDE